MKKTRNALIVSLLSMLLCFSMLLGTSWAWFTDSVTSAGNIIQSGTLDVQMHWADGTNDPTSATYTDAATGAIFNYDKWEPGYVDVKHVKISNAGTLALKYQLNIVANGTVSKLADVIDVYFIDPATQITSRTALNDSNKLGTLREVIKGLSDGKHGNGYLEAGKSVTVTLVLKMQESAGNEYQGLSIGTDFSVQLIATQFSYESDSFGPDYDQNAEWPEMNLGHSVTVSAGKLDADNKTTAPITMSGYGYNVTLPAGVKAADGADEFTLTVDTTDRSSNINMNAGQVSRSLDVHIDGIDENNDVPVVINLGAVLPIGYKAANIALYHVEDGVANQMNLVAAPALHNDFSYNAETGEVSVALASFSEVTAVVAAGDPWAGGVDTSWYNTNDTEFTLANEDQFAGFAAIVGGMANGIKQDTFADKTVKLGANLDLGSKNGKIFTPVGYYFTNDKSANGIPNENKEDIYSTVYSFEGTFDGQNHTIANILQRTWDIKGDDPHYSLPANQYYNDGMGIFGFVYNGKVKNLVVSNFQSDGEFSTTGCVAAYASGSSTFDNIKVVNSNPRAYNVPNGGVVGYAYNQSGSTAVVNFNNITVDSSNKISALWGSWDVGCGGILGRVNGDTTVNMTNCTVGAVIDVYNDVCGNYQYYQYRYAGMLVGTVGGDTDPLTGGEKVNFSNVKVYIGNWADYYYCEFEKNTVGSYTTDYQFSRVEKNEINIDPATNLPYKQNLSPCRHQHTANEDKMGTYLPFDQLYTGYGWGSSPVRSAEGVQVIKYFYTVTYMDGKGENVLATEYVTEGERSETKLWANAHTVKTGALTTNEGKKFVGWMNANSEKTDTVPAGNYKDVILYESWENPYIIRFVNIDGEVVYSEAWTSSNQGLSFTPDVPEIEGYVGSWEDGWKTKLQNVTSDVTIKPIYILAGYEDNEDHVHIDSTLDAKALFAALAKGQSVIMGADISASGKKDLGITGGVNNLCVIEGTTSAVKNSRLNLNSFELNCTFDHNANKSWHMFDIKDNAKLTITGGVYGDGTMVVNFNDIKSPVYLFNIDGGTLVLEAGVNIEIHYDAKDKDKVFAFAYVDENDKAVTQDFSTYSGIYVDRTVDGVLRITVGVTTTINRDTILATQNN